MRTLPELASDLGLRPDQVIPWGPGLGKLDRDVVLAQRPPRGRLVLVSATTPTPAGEGKTTTSIGLVQGLRRLGRNAIVALRQPSQGPVFGRKGGGTGGGASRLVPGPRINLGATGDFHAITSAHNLLAAIIDNKIHFGESGAPDPRRVSWPRILDVNDRSLRHVVLGLGGKGDGVPREGRFDIVAASELMAVLGMCTGEADLRERLSRMVVGEDSRGELVRAGTQGAVGAMMALLADAMLPNLAQTCEGAPALIHTGPFANIAHGCSSVLSTRVALGLSDFVVTEAGFAFDLGGQKFLDLKCRGADLVPSLVVLVTTIRALKHHGEGDLKRGLDNLRAHLDAIAAYGLPSLVAINRFPSDEPGEIAGVCAAAQERGSMAVEADPYGAGGVGCQDLARAVAEMATPTPPRWLFPDDATIPERIRAVATTVYGAADVRFEDAAEKALAGLAKRGLDRMPVCTAKTEASLSDDATARGRPRDFTLRVKDLRLSAGAGWVVALCGEIRTMPGLPRRPQAEGIDLIDGVITGVEG